MTRHVAKLGWPAGAQCSTLEARQTIQNGTGEREPNLHRTRRQRYVASMSARRAHRARDRVLASYGSERYHSETFVDAPPGGDLVKQAAPSFKSHCASSAASSWAKQRTLARDTRPEIRLRRALWARGLRYRVNVKEIVGKPDIVFLRLKVAVFCDGDFFHGKDWSLLRKQLTHRANASYWIKKIEYNKRRDRSITKKLTNAGWLVLRFWESEINGDVLRVACAVESAVKDGSG
jgi:DNA mismatch endonuclease, patch repair protein